MNSEELRRIVEAFSSLLGKKGNVFYTAFFFFEDALVRQIATTATTDAQDTAYIAVSKVDLEDLKGKLLGCRIYALR